MGRKTLDFDKDFWIEGEGLNLVKEWAEGGMTDKAIGEKIGIQAQTVVEWKKRYEKFGLVLKQARNVVMRDLENAMYRSATGYFVEEDALDRNGNVVKVQRYIAPAPQTQIWLSKNWDSANYKDKRDLDVSGSLPVILTGESELKD